MGIGTDLLGSALGMTETAYLVVLDTREKITPPADNIPEGSNPLGDVVKAAKKAKQAANVVSGALANLVTSGDTKQASGIEDHAGAVSKYYRVQFNPSELSINTSDFVNPETSIQNSKDGVDKPVDTSISTGGSSVLSLNLYFDQMNKADAFSADKFSLSASSIGSNIATAVLKGLGKEWTVQPQVEALISALRNSATRQVSFYWSDFSYTGSLNFISAQYTMFSLSGNPIRAKVSLRIEQSLDTKLMTAWHRDFNAMFGGNSSLVSMGQKVGGLLNINL